MAVTLNDKSKAKQDLEWAIAHLRHLHATFPSMAEIVGQASIDRIIAALEKGQTGLLAELDRREAIVVAAEAWAKSKRSEQSENWPRSATTLLISETAEANLLALLPAAALKG